MDSKKYGVYQKNIKEESNIKVLQTTEEKTIASLFLALLWTNKLYLSEEYFNFIRPLFKKVFEEELKEDQTIVVLVGNYLYPNLTITLEKNKNEERYFVKSITSSGIFFTGNKENKGPVYELRM
ncbi:MAG: hypothetical protein E7311_06520 [Clostridiales bacterium]|nr:hypothetical protein [Clostridiales bacterium]